MKNGKCGFILKEKSAEQLLEDYVLNRLTKKESEKVEEHIFGCNICFEEVVFLECLIKSYSYKKIKEKISKEKRIKALKKNNFVGEKYNFYKIKDNDDKFDKNIDVISKEKNTF